MTARKATTDENDQSAPAEPAPAQPTPPQPTPAEPAPLTPEALDRLRARLARKYH